MKRFVVGQDRSQLILLPECLDDYVGEENPVRISTGASTVTARKPSASPKSYTRFPTASTLTGRSLQATATGRNAPEPSSSRARRPTVLVGSFRSLARFGCQRCVKRDVTGHIIMADGSYRTV
jgi:hypothetical protein